MQAIRFVLLAMLLALPTAAPSLADEEKDNDVLNCINTGRIRNTKVVDDLNILFYTRGKTIYHNILPRQCRGLSREGRFSYHIPGSSLCQLDTIRILYRGAIGLEEGRSCQLGYFHEITDEDAEGIIEGSRQPPQAEPLPPAEPEEVIEESDES